MQQSDGLYHMIELATLFRALLIFSTVSYKFHHDLYNRKYLIHLVL